MSLFKSTLPTLHNMMSYSIFYFYHDYTGHTLIYMVLQWRKSLNNLGSQTPRGSGNGSYIVDDFHITLSHIIYYVHSLYTFLWKKIPVNTLIKCCIQAMNQIFHVKGENYHTTQRELQVYRLAFSSLSTHGLKTTALVHSHLCRQLCFQITLPAQQQTEGRQSKQPAGEHCGALSS